MFPDGDPAPTPPTMNYAVIYMAVWGGALLYYFIDARNWFTSPKITVDVEGLTTKQQETLAAEGLNLGNREGVVVGGDKQFTEWVGEKNDSGPDSA